MQASNGHFNYIIMRFCTIGLAAMGCMITVQIHAQIRIVDNKTPSTGVSFAQILTTTGEYIGMLDIDGVLSKELTDRYCNDSIRIYHIGYSDTTVFAECGLASASIMIREKSSMLPEVDVRAARLDHQRRFISLQTCYRTWQTQDATLKYYQDGNASYVLDAKKNRIWYDLGLHRTMINDSLERAQDHDAKLVLELTGVPRLDNDFLPNTLLRKTDYAIIYNSDSSSAFALRTIGDTVARASLVNGILTLAVEQPTIKSTFSGFGFSNRITSKTFYYKFRHRTLDESLKIKSFHGLLYCMVQLNYELEHKKSGTVSQVHYGYEVLVNSEDDAGASDTKELSERFGMRRSSSEEDFSFVQCGNGEGVNRTFNQNGFLEKSIRKMRKF